MELEHCATDARVEGSNPSAGTRFLKLRGCIMSFMFYDEYKDYLENKYEDYDPDGGLFSNHYWSQNYDFNEEEYTDYCKYKLYN